MYFFFSYFAYILYIPDCNKIPSVFQSVYELLPPLISEALCIQTIFLLTQLGMHMLSKALTNVGTHAMTH